MTKLTKNKTLERVDDIEKDERKRESLAKGKEGAMDRIREAFGEPEDPSIQEVRDFLMAAARNLDAVEGRLQIRDEETSQLVEMSWPQLVGTTLSELELAPRVKLLVMDVIAGLIPDGSTHVMGELANAAGMAGVRSASPDSVSRFKKQGLLMAFVAKIFLDSKRLLAEGEEQRAKVYFDEAQAMAQRLMKHPYLDSRDKRFLKTCKKRYGGDLEHLVQTQKKTVLSRVEPQEGHPELERTLRKLSSEDYREGDPQETSRVQGMEAWWEEAQKEFTPTRFVFSEIDELRRHVQREMRRFEEGEALSDPDETSWQTGRRLREALQEMKEELKDTPAELFIPKGETVNLLSFIRENARVLGAPYAVSAFKRFMERKDVVEHYALHQVAAFQKKIPDLRGRLKASLYVCDELYRSAPLGPRQKEQLEGLRKEIVSYAESQGHPVPQKTLETRWNVPFAEEMFNLLTTPEEFKVFEEWLQRIREVYDRGPERSASMELDALETIDMADGVSLRQRGRGSRSSRKRKKLVSTLLGMPSPQKSGPGTLPAVQGSGGEGGESREIDAHEGSTAAPAHERAANRGGRSFWDARFWPWNWFRKRGG